VKLEWSRLAIADRNRIFDYIVNHNPQAAINVDNRIIEQVKLLVVFPELGRPGRIANTRELVVNSTPYIVAYDATDKAIKILRILHGAQLWPEHIEN
jgi:addiction module RelE/StbE family toxin